MVEVEGEGAKLEAVPFDIEWSCWLLLAKSEEQKNSNNDSLRVLATSHAKESISHTSTRETFSRSRLNGERVRATCLLNWYL